MSSRTSGELTFHFSTYHDQRLIRNHVLIHGGDNGIAICGVHGWDAHLVMLMNRIVLQDGIVILRIRKITEENSVKSQVFFVHGVSRIPAWKRSISNCKLNKVGKTNRGSKRSFLCIMKMVPLDNEISMQKQPDTHLVSGPLYPSTTNVL